MLSLGEQIRGYQARVGRCVGEHHNFRRAGQQRDAHCAEDLPLRSHRIGGTRADDLVYRRNALRAIRQRTHGLRSTHGVHLVNAQQACGSRNRRMYLADFHWRRNHAELVHASHLRGHGRHQQARKQRHLASRHAQPHSLNGSDFLAQHHPVAVFDKPRVELLPLVEGANVGYRRLHRNAQVRVQRSFSLGEHGRRHPQLSGAHLHAIEALRQRAQRGIAFFPHLPQNVPHRVLDLGVGFGAARKQGGERLGERFGGIGRNGYLSLSKGGHQYTTLLSGYSMMPSAPSRLSGGINSRTTRSSATISSATHSSSIWLETVGVCRAGSRAMMRSS